ncbi:zinc finger protein 239-like [Branchiostoma floridae]|uniref:Zinc finger protein 239-like n=1 Tax=Branchiostoma floridae TaxID=7739 RepID=A0A9J7MR95_BRAFL|nr:zinc finger protein 239-like [Branchiostoma floridae]
MNNTGNPGKEMDRAEHPGKDSDSRVTLTTTMGLQKETCEVNFSHPDNTSTSQENTLGPCLVPRSFIPAQGVENHVVKQTGETRYMCEVCGSRTARKCNLALHKRTDTEEISFESDQRDYSEAQKGHLDNHRIPKTSVDKPYMCEKCGYGTSSQKSALNTHLKTHTGEKPFMCGECGHRTMTKLLLVQHMRTHTGEKPYGCDLCEYSAGVKACLERHIMVKHTGEKPYKCSECEFKTADSSHFYKHMKKHSGEKLPPRKKSHKCGECDYSTSQKCRLDQHIISKHSGEKPYRCDKCDLRTASKSRLSLHMRKHENPYKCHQCDFYERKIIPVRRVRI